MDKNEQPPTPPKRQSGFSLFPFLCHLTLAAVSLLIHPSPSIHLSLARLCSAAPIVLFPLYSVVRSVVLPIVLLDNSVRPSFQSPSSSSFILVSVQYSSCLDYGIPCVHQRALDKDDTWCRSLCFLRDCQRCPQGGDTLPGK